MHSGCDSSHFTVQVCLCHLCLSGVVIILHTGSELGTSPDGGGKAYLLIAEFTQPHCYPPPDDEVVTVQLECHVNVRNY